MHALCCPALRPHVLRPNEIPVVTDPAEAARRPELGVLSALLIVVAGNMVLPWLPLVLVLVVVEVCWKRADLDHAEPRRADRFETLEDARSVKAASG